MDRFGVWLSLRQVRRHLGETAGKRLGDFGCGYDAMISRTLLDRFGSALVVDLSLTGEVKGLERVTAIEGELPDVLRDLPDASLDVVLCLSVLEHLWQPQETLVEMRRLLAPGGVCLINVPSWRGKFFLEFSAFRLGFSDREEMEDHKTYYDRRDLWPMLVRAGYLPSHVKVFKHKFGLNTFAVCRTAAAAGRGEQ